MILVHEQLGCVLDSSPDRNTVKWLSYEIRNTHLKTFHLNIPCGFSTYDDNRYPLQQTMLSHIIQYSVSIHIRHDEIQQHSSYPLAIRFQDLYRLYTI